MPIVAGIADPKICRHIALLVEYAYSKLLNLMVFRMN